MLLIFVGSKDGKKDHGVKVSTKEYLKNNLRTYICSLKFMSVCTKNLAR